MVAFGNQVCQTRAQLDREADIRLAESEAPEQDWWRIASRISTIGIFVLLLGAFLFFARTLVAPIVAAVIISIMFGPLAAKAAQYRIPALLFLLYLFVREIYNYFSKDSVKDSPIAISDILDVVSMVLLLLGLITILSFSV